MTNKRDVEVGVEDVELWFEKYKDDVSIQDEGDKITVYPTHYLGNELFGKLATISRQNNGKYIKADKANKVKGHFEFSSGKQTQKIKQVNNGTYFTLHCPYCGKSMDVTVTPKKEA